MTSDLRLHRCYISVFVIHHILTKSLSIDLIRINNKSDVTTNLHKRESYTQTSLKHRGVKDNWRQTWGEATVKLTP